MDLGAGLRPTAGLVEKQRMIKSQPEIEAIRTSVQTNSKAFAKAIAKIRPANDRDRSRGGTGIPDAAATARKSPRLKRSWPRAYEPRSLMRNPRRKNCISYY